MHLFSVLGVRINIIIIIWVFVDGRTSVQKVYGMFMDGRTSVQKVYGMFMDGRTSVQKVYGMFMDSSLESDGWMMGIKYIDTF